LPDGVVNPAQFPGYAHKEALIQLETAEDIEGYINTVDFSSKTKHDLKLLLASASGKEFRTANYNKWEALEQLADFKIGLIDLEVLVPREDRDRREFESVCRALKKLYIDNLSQCTRDEYGRNVFWAQYVDETRTSSYAEVNEKQHVTSINPTSGGFKLSNVPIIGGFIK
jgi:hypothetical protein